MKRRRSNGFPTFLPALFCVVAAALLAACGQEAGTTIKGASGQGYRKGGTCSPAPCAVGDGIEVLVTRVQRDLPNSSAGGAATSGHRVKLSVTFKADANVGKDSPGGPEINPQEFQLIDAQGKAQSFSPAADAECSAVKPIQLKQGQTAGPIALCYDASGAASGPLKLEWAAGFLAAPLDIALQ